VLPLYRVKGTGTRRTAETRGPPGAAGPRVLPPPTICRVIRHRARVGASPEAAGVPRHWVPTTGPPVATWSSSSSAVC